MNISLDGGPASRLIDREMPLRVCIITGLPVTEQLLTDREFSSENRRCNTDIVPFTRPSPREGS